MQQESFYKVFFTGGTRYLVESGLQAQQQQQKKTKQNTHHNKTNTFPATLRIETL